jgi:hypothetical protein
MSATLEIPAQDLPTLLETAGAHPRGNRHDCPKCGGFRTITHSAEAFFCHKCQWKGNTFTLAKELGVYRRLSSAEYQKLRQRRERAHEAAERLYAAVRVRRFELYDELRGLSRIDAGGHQAGLGYPAAWDALEMGYRNRPALLAELSILENCGAADLVKFLSADDETRGRVIARVIQRGGLYDCGGKFIEVTV